MKKLILPLIVAFALIATGCKTSNSPGRVLATTTISVDGAMKGWAVWVAQERATVSDEAKVRVAYARYQLAEQVAERAYVTAVKLNDQTVWVQAATVLDACKLDLLALISSLSHQPK